jgi:hypothetical protein
VALAPDQAPEAIHEVALVADQFSVALLPLVTALGPTLRLTVGVGDLTEIVVDWTAVPPRPEQASVYVESAARTPVDCVPLAGLLPDQAPEAVHDVAFTAFHLRAELVPLAIVLGAALMLTVGAVDFTEIVANWVALPPGPVQVRE